MKASRILSAAAVIALSMAHLGVYAQTTPGTRPDNQQTTTPHQGWTMWDDRIGTEFELPPVELQRLRDVDMRYKKEYDALGDQPWTDPRYKTLTDRRNNDIRGILSNDQYMRWERTYGGQMNKPTNKTGGTTPGSGTTPTPAPK